MILCIYSFFFPIYHYGNFLTHLVGRNKFKASRMRVCAISVLGSFRFARWMACATVKDTLRSHHDGCQVLNML